MLSTVYSKLRSEGIKRELLQVYVAVICSLAVVSVGFLVVHEYVVNNYRTTITTTVQERQLLTITSNLTSAYNTLYLNSNTTTAATQQQLNQAKASLERTTLYLDKAIVDNQSKADYIGLENLINTLVSTINDSLKDLSNGNISDYTTDYNKVTQLYNYIQSSDTSLIFSQLDYINTISPRLNRDYDISEITGAVALIMVSAECLIYTYRFAGRLTKPLSQLTTVARKISGGTNDASIGPELLNRQDEIGSLASSFNIMLGKLNANLTELMQQNTIIENKVAERTSELMQEEARLTSSVQSLSLGYVMTGEHQDIVLINEAAKLILSYQITPGGVSVHALEPDKHDWTIDDLQHSLKANFDFKEILSRVMHDRQPIENKSVEYNGRILHIFIAPVTENDKVIGAVSLIEDITEEKVAERSKDEFFSIASHELRTPLTAIRGNSDMLQQFFAKKVNDDDFDQMISDIHTSSIRLISIVNDFLDASRLEQGKLRLSLQAFDIERVIEGIIYDMSEMSKAKQNRLENKINLDSLPKAYADKDRVQQILYNLIGNAMKLTENGVISVECAVINKMLKVSVSDTGPGISEQNQRVLFHKFQQASDNILTRESSQSTGLGLYISRLLASKMGGEVSLERSQLGKGSTFSFTMPLYADQVQSASETSQ